MKKCCVLLLTIAMITSCAKVSITPKKAIKQTNETYVLTVEGGVAEEFYSADPFIGTVDMDGLVTTKHVGETQIGVKVDGQAYEVALQVVPSVVAFEEPLTDWTLTAADITRQFGQPMASQMNGNSGFSMYADITKKLVTMYVFMDDNLAATALLWFKYDLPKFKQQLAEYYELWEETEIAEQDTYTATYGNDYNTESSAPTTFVNLVEMSLENFEGLEGMEGMESFGMLLQMMGASANGRICIITYVNAEIEQ